ncbi:MAG: YhcB family protein [Pseudomonadota bacterium]
MNSGMEDLIFVGIVCAAIGLLIGYLTGRNMAPGSQQTRELEDALENAQQSRERFEQQVNSHFADTADKLNALTANYKDVYEHLARGAQDLCTTEGAKAFSSLQSIGADEIKAIESDEVITEPPLDYAPKASPEDPGVLNERFGLDEDEAPPSEKVTRESP